MSSRGHSPERRKALIKMIEDDGWYLARSKGDHHHYKHPTKKGLVTIPYKITRNIELSVQRQAGLRRYKSDRINYSNNSSDGAVIHRPKANDYR